MERKKTYWATEAERDDWFRHAVTSGEIGWPSIAYMRPFTLVSDEHGRELDA